MTLTQLSAFVLVSRLGSVKSAAIALDVSEPAVSQALAALRKHFDDPLVVRGTQGMALTPGGKRLLPIAAQMVAAGADAEAAVRAGQGAPELLRVVATSTIAEFVAAPLADAFARRAGQAVDVSSGLASGDEIPVLIANRLADIALGPPSGDVELGLESDPIFRGQLVVVASAKARKRHGPPPWLVDPAGAETGGDVGRLTRRLGIAESRVQVYPNQTAAWAAVANGDGIAPAYAHLVARQVARGELVVVETPATPLETSWYATTLSRDRRSIAASSLRRFLGTPEAMQLMRFPGSGVPPSRFRPPVYVTIWS
ncbi:MAG: LysR family transcriptional regulator [Streptosporangiales bacterium]|nr:LysR family transcriptional regulator [Streptosporangiales bacterium]